MSKQPFNTVTLCGRCVSQFYNTGQFLITRVDRYQINKNECTYCGYRRGFDYSISPKCNKSISYEEGIFSYVR